MKQKDFAQALKEAKAVYMSASKEFEAAQLKWRATGYKINEVYKEYQIAERAKKSAQEIVERFTILCSSKIYANQYFYTDVEPWEVVEIKTERCLVVRPMIAELKQSAQKALAESFVPGGFFGHTDNSKQEWIITSDETAETCEIRMHKDGLYYMSGSKGTRFHLSTKPRKFYDYNF